MKDSGLRGREVAFQKAFALEWMMSWWFGHKCDFFAHFKFHERRNPIDLHGWTMSIVKSPPAFYYERLYGRNGGLAATRMFMEGISEMGGMSGMVTTRIDKSSRMIHFPNGFPDPAPTIVTRCLNGISCSRLVVDPPGYGTALFEGTRNDCNTNYARTPGSGRIE
ncbi:hypothetical protein VKT23_009010 [Stygiomarasmius scandens]|uniref:Uncharacterized protein n=1 Tax=Marasmiellus scandens TaxID=2682957 RepID=A0ABR1JLI0_9AGAR